MPCVAGVSTPAGVSPPCCPIPSDIFRSIPADLISLPQPRTGHCLRGGAGNAFLIAGSSGKGCRTPDGCGSSTGTAAPPPAAEAREGAHPAVTVSADPRGATATRAAGVTIAEKNRCPESHMGGAPGTLFRADGLSW